jgi:lipopolysaccharide transport system permease protein
MNPVVFREVETEVLGLSIRVRVTLENRSRETWRAESFSLGWQFFDPESNRFILEGEWVPSARDVPAGASASFELAIAFPPEPGGYRIYVSPVDQSRGWSYTRGESFLLLQAEVSSGEVRLLHREVTTLRSLQRRRLRSSLPKFLSGPWRTVLQNRRLIRSMARRDILARYRGSFGDVFWTILNPLLLMTTYFFVFGVVLQTRFGPEQSSTGFALYFLAGMLPWLAFSESAGRAPFVILEHRNFVKKLIFPLETLPVNQVVSGLVTELFAAGIFLVALLLIRHSIPLAMLWLPILLIPQLLFTLGMCWFLAALGVFFRDLGQIMGFLLTLWFFITPICYAENHFDTLPAAMVTLLHKNPMFVLVRGYRSILLEHHAPALFPLVKLWLVGFLLCWFGYAWFFRLRKSFADFI